MQSGAALNIITTAVTLALQTLKEIALIVIEAKFAIDRGPRGYAIAKLRRVKIDVSGVNAVGECVVPIGEG